MPVLLFCSVQLSAFHFYNERWALQRTLFQEFSKYLPSLSYKTAIGNRDVYEDRQVRNSSWLGACLHSDAAYICADHFHSVAIWQKISHMPAAQSVRSDAEIN
jgi:hypothetical protein